VLGALYATLSLSRVCPCCSFYQNNTMSVCVGGTNALAGSTGSLSGVSNGAGGWLASFQLSYNSLFLINGLQS
jgi:hypothetical protein